MGAWSASSFENDDAADWIYELEEADDLEILETTLESAAENDDYLEAPEGSMAIAAAEVVAALLGKPAPELPDEVTAFVARMKAPPNRGLAELALKAVERVKTRSELQELWDEGENAKAWHALLADLSKRLG
ncbi:MAG: DUF4259 domain-containing protein [Deltaproteobacteria bacterium]|nr:DUF4259 domain-containing protein [Deltaproteobacteria bacterium]